jgi:hypothetical protein
LGWEPKEIGGRKNEEEAPSQTHRKKSEEGKNYSCSLFFLNSQPLVFFRQENARVWQKK